MLEKVCCSNWKGGLLRMHLSIDNYYKRCANNFHLINALAKLIILPTICCRTKFSIQGKPPLIKAVDIPG